jgi:hypothetical protein
MAPPLTHPRPPLTMGTERKRRGGPWNILPHPVALVLVLVLVLGRGWPAKD